MNFYEGMCVYYSFIEKRRKISTSLDLRDFKKKTACEMEI
jgi:hypothetical protein